MLNLKMQTFPGCLFLIGIAFGNTSLIADATDLSTSSAVSGLLSKSLSLVQSNKEVKTVNLEDRADPEEAHYSFYHQHPI